MRKQTLGTIIVIMIFVSMFLFKPLFRSYPILFISYPLFIAALIVLNQYILAWRKKHGRDIEEEEKHENAETGTISIRPRKTDNDIT